MSNGALNFLTVAAHAMNRGTELRLQMQHNARQNQAANQRLVLESGLRRREAEAAEAARRAPRLLTPEEIDQQLDIARRTGDIETQNRLKVIAAQESAAMRKRDTEAENNPLAVLDYQIQVMTKAYQGGLLNRPPETLKPSQRALVLETAARLDELYGARARAGKLSPSETTEIARMSGGLEAQLSVMDSLEHLGLPPDTPLRGDAINRAVARVSGRRAEVYSPGDEIPLEQFLLQIYSSNMLGVPEITLEGVADVVQMAQQADGQRPSFGTSLRTGEGLGTTPAEIGGTITRKVGQEISERRGTMLLTPASRGAQPITFGSPQAPAPPSVAPGPTRPASPLRMPTAQAAEPTARPLQIDLENLQRARLTHPDDNAFVVFLRNQYGETLAMRLMQQLQQKYGRRGG